MIIGILSAEPAKYGWGHYARCHGLVTVFRGAGHTVFWNEDQTLPLELVRTSGIELDWLLIDHPDPNVLRDLGIWAKRRGYLAGNSGLTRPLFDEVWDLILVQGIRESPREVDPEKWFIGLQYVLIRPEITALAPLLRKGRPREKIILVYPHHLQSAVPEGWRIQNPGSFYVSRGLVRFGMVSLELALLGIPQVILQRGAVPPTARFLMQKGVAVILDEDHAFRHPDELDEILFQLEPFDPQKKIGSAFDGMGCWRLMQIMSEKLGEKTSWIPETL